MMSWLVSEIIYVSLFYIVDRYDRAIGNERVLFCNECFVDTFFHNSLYFLRNDLDSWVIVWVGSFTYNAS